MTYQNTETGETRGGQGFVKRLNRHGSLEKSTTDCGEILRAVIDVDGTSEEWVSVEDDR